jgi:hypothetical protein
VRRIVIQAGEERESDPDGGPEAGEQPQVLEQLPVRRARQLSMRFVIDMLERR